MKSFRSEEPLSTTSKHKGFVFDIGNQSTTRKQQKIPFQMNTLNTEECDNDTYRSQQAFKKLKNLEFQNDLFIMEMQHAQRRKEAESNRLKFQLSSIKSDIDFMKSQLQSPVAKQKQKPKHKRSQSIDSEESSDRSSSSSSDNSYVKCPIKFKHYEPVQKEQQLKVNSYETIENKFKKLFEISDVNDKLNWMIKQYFNSFHSIQLDLQNNLLPLLLENTLKLLIEIIDKLNSIKLDTLSFKSYDPFQNGEKYTNKQYSTDLDVETINQEYHSQGNHTLTDYCQKFSEQPQKNQFSTPQYKQQQPEQQQSTRQLQNMMKSKPDSSYQTSNNQTLDKKVSISERSQKKTTQKSQLMPSLKNRQK